jgi:hypothetical protein
MEIPPAKTNNLDDYHLALTELRDLILEGLRGYHNEINSLTAQNQLLKEENKKLRASLEDIACGGNPLETHK